MPAAHRNRRTAGDSTGTGVGVAVTDATPDPTTNDDDLARLRRLFLFDAVCEAGGIGQAAARVGRTQPAVSLAVSRLEAGFGGALLKRGASGSELTAEGAILHRRVRRMLEQMEQGVRALLGPHASDTNVRNVCRHLSDSQVRCHIAIAGAGSAAEAARQMNLSQPAVHRAARQLEQVLGVSLYRRRVHNIAANPAGIEFARCLSLAMVEIAQAREDLAQARGALTGRIAIGALPMLPPRLMARTIERLRRHYPAARVTVDEGMHERLLRELRSGRIDVIVGALREPRLKDGAQEFALFDDPYVLAVRKGHPLAARRSIAAKDLAAYDWVVPQRNVPRRAVIDSILSRLPVQVRLVAETSSLPMMMAMLVEGDCITLLARSLIVEANPGSEMVALKLALDAPEAERVVGYTVRSDWLATAVQEQFIACLRDECGSRSAQRQR